MIDEICFFKGPKANGCDLLKYLASCNLIEVKKVKIIQANVIFEKKIYKARTSDLFITD